MQSVLPRSVSRRPDFARFVVRQRQRISRHPDQCRSQRPTNGRRTCLVEESTISPGMIQAGYYTIACTKTRFRNQGALLAFTLPQKWRPGAGLSIVATHIDSPNLRVRKIAQIAQIRQTIDWDLLSTQYHNTRCARSRRRQSLGIYRLVSKHTAVGSGIRGSTAICR